MTNEKTHDHTKGEQVKPEGKKKNKSHGSPLSNLVTSLTVGFLAACSTKTLTAPLERIQILWITRFSNPEFVSGRQVTYKNYMDCFKRVKAEQGFKSFWRGNLANILRYAPQQTSALAFNDVIYNKIFPKYDAHQDFWKSFACKLGAGWSAATLASAMCYPLDMAHVRLAADTGTAAPRFKGITDCVVSTVRNGGVFSGLYAGFSASLAGTFIHKGGKGISLGVFSQLQLYNPYKTDKGPMGYLSTFGAVALSRTALMLLTYPWQTMRFNTMLGGDLPKAERAYSGSFDCARKLVRNHGFRALYAGALFEFYKGVGGASVIVAYDRIKAAYHL